MFYFLKGKNSLGTLKSPNIEMLVYPNIQDLRNYAFLYIYPNGEIDGVIRTGNLAGHFYAIEPLLKISPNLKSFYQSFKETDDVTHYNLDENLAAHGVLEIYYSTSDLSDEEAFGYINMPSQLTDFQKNFLINHRAYFAVYEDLLVCQYNEDMQGLDSLNELGDGNFLEIIDQTCTSSLNAKNSR